jgi:hypothetical protein
MQSSIDIKAQLKELALREQAKDKNLPAFPLWALLTIYCKAEHECYIDYMAGFKALVSWLGPIAKEPCNDLVKIDILSTYTTQQMADILNYFEEEILATLIYKVLPNVK